MGKRLAGPLMSFRARGVLGGHRRGPSRRRFPTPPVMTLSDAIPLPVGMPPAAGDSEEASRANHLHLGSRSRLGRVKAHRYSCPGWQMLDGWGVLDQNTTGIIYFTPIYVAEQTTYTKILTRVAVGHAGKLFRFGLYAWDDGVPGSLITDFGTVSVSSAGTKFLTISETLSPGFYFVATIQNGANARYYRAPEVLSIAPVEGARFSTLLTMPLDRCHVTCYGIDVGDQTVNGLADPASPRSGATIPLVIAWRLYEP